MAAGGQPILPVTRRRAAGWSTAVLLVGAGRVVERGPLSEAGGGVGRGAASPLWPTRIERLDAAR